jgi:hypothetical protein
MLRRSPIGILFSAVLLVVAIGFGVSKAVHGVGEAKKAVTQASGGAQSAGAADDDSLIRSANLEKALAAVKAKGGDQVLELRLEPGEARFQVREGDGAKGWAYTKGGDLNDFRIKLIGPGRIEDNVFPIAQLDAGTPERIVQGIHAKAPRYDLKDVQFMTLDIEPVSGKFVWAVNIGTPGSGNLYQADLDGSNVRSPGEAGAQAGQAAQGITDCITKAAGDPTKIQACATG